MCQENTSPITLFLLHTVNSPGSYGWLHFFFLLTYSRGDILSGSHTHKMQPFSIRCMKAWRRHPVRQADGGSHTRVPQLQGCMTGYLGPDTSHCQALGRGSMNCLFKKLYMEITAPASECFLRIK